MEAIWGSDAPNIDENVAPKRQRLFIARQACESCRLKKTRCDGGNPCGLCRTAGIECKFAERKATKNEVSLGMIFNTLQRIESKIESQQEHQQYEHQEQQLKRTRNGSFTVPQAGRSPSERVRRLSSNATATDLASPSMSTHVVPAVGNTSTSGIHPLLSTTSPVEQLQYDTPPTPSAQLHQHRPPQPRHVPVIQYPIRQLANWPAVRALLHEANGGKDSSVYTYDAAAATILEQRRAPLPLPLSSLSLDDNWLAQLHISVVKDLGDKYFATFNLTNPILDRKLFSQHSLGVAINSSFGVNIESCVVLVTMALGVLGRKALREAGLDREATASSPYEHREGEEEWDDGLIFFNEARKRIGLLNCDNSLQACQYYLLSGLFYSQLIRPVDWWSVVSKASACCTSFWACLPKDCDEWTLDMQARLFWITAMFEAVLTQELDVPVSNLLNYEDRVPLPKFVEFPGVSSFVSLMTTSSYLPSAQAAQEAEQDSFCHYHFLSQIAHRIILTRLCDSMFANRSKALASGKTIEAASQATTMARSDYPPQALEDELLHQLEQWRSQLPSYLQWEDDNEHRYADSEIRLAPTTPANIFVVPWLQARYCIARYHLRRPLLHRALHHPDWMTPGDFDKCRDAIASAIRWCSTIRPALEVMDCLYLKFFICTQLFGLLLLLHTLDSSPVLELRELVPDTYLSWRIFAFDFLEKYAPMSPSVAREYEIVSPLRNYRRNESLASRRGSK